MPNQESDQTSHKAFSLGQGQTDIADETKNQTYEEIMIIAWKGMRL